MASEGDGHRTQIIIALIGLAGVVLAALISNWDKFFDRREAPAVVQQAPVPASGSAVSPPIESVERLADAQKGALDASSGALEDVAAKIAASSAPPSTIADVSGIWRDTDGYEYAVRQKAQDYAYRQLQGGVEVGSGEGQVSGSRVRQHFIAKGDEGDCAGEIEAGGEAIFGICTSGTAQWRYRIVRVSKN